MVRMVKRVLWWMLPVLALAAGWWYWQGRTAGEAPQWRLVEVSRGDVTATVGATGTLGAIRTVEVGTQVSGQIVELKADFNDRVRQGQLIARLDDTLLEQAVRQAEADLVRAEADLVYKRYLLEQAETLRAAASLAESDLRAAALAVAQAEATRISADAGLDRARRNLSYAEIVAPISGIVINRNVELGQTVAASLQAPQLFLIAESLERMQILASVDESDIGRVREGQLVEFTVQAWPERRFGGKVRQIRMQPATSENVVNYTAVVEVDNPGGVLMPGMTATLDFIVDRAAEVLLVPNAALRFRPSEELLAQLRQERQARRDSSAVPGDARRDSAGGGQRQPGMARGGVTDGSVLWVLVEGRPRPLRIKTGLTDGSRTEVSGEGLAVGLQVIAGQLSSGAATGTASPFQTQQAAQPGPPRGGF